MMAAVFAAGCNKSDDPNNSGNNGGGNNGGGHYNGNYEYVDLGLPSGTLWATFNVGADKPEDTGDYFAWGEIQPKYAYSYSTYQYCMGSYNTLTKYCCNTNFGNHGYNGFIDNQTTLLPEDDAATANWGNGWRMPTIEEWVELYKNTTYTWTSRNGVNGRLFTASNGNSLFLPAVGYRFGTSVDLVGSVCYYWTSLLDPYDPNHAWTLYTGLYCDRRFDENHRCDDFPVRPVRAN